VALIQFQLLFRDFSLDIAAVEGGIRFFQYATSPGNDYLNGKLLSPSTYFLINSG
jgi:hypothetical protein